MILVFIIDIVISIIYIILAMIIAVVIGLLYDWKLGLVSCIFFPFLIVGRLMGKIRQLFLGNGTNLLSLLLTFLILHAKSFTPTNWDAIFDTFIKIQLFEKPSYIISTLYLAALLVTCQLSNDFWAPCFTCTCWQSLRSLSALTLWRSSPSKIRPSWPLRPSPTSGQWQVGLGRQACHWGK